MSLWLVLAQSVLFGALGLYCFSLGNSMHKQTDKYVTFAHQSAWKRWMIFGLMPVDKNDADGLRKRIKLISISWCLFGVALMLGSLFGLAASLQAGLGNGF